MAKKEKNELTGERVSESTGSKPKTEDNGNVTEQNPADTDQKDESKVSGDEVIDPVFASNPNLDVYYRTSDGTSFYTDNAAALHTAKLEDKEITKITKG